MFAFYFCFSINLFDLKKKTLSVVAAAVTVCVSLINNYIQQQNIKTSQNQNDEFK